MTFHTNWAYNNQPQNLIILQMGKWGTRAHSLGV